MMCKKPSHGRNGRYWPCGMCIFCRINNLRKRTSRIMLERSKHESSVFATFTLDNEHLTEGLEPDHLRLLWYQLRNYGFKDFRYYAVGEYGGHLFGEPEAERACNPHYHAALFNFPQCLRGETNLTHDLPCCEICTLVRSAWSRGRIHLGSLEGASAMYIAQYVTKKMTGKDDHRLGGRHPEFARMSSKPGIGALAAADLAALMRTPAGEHIMLQTEDVMRTYTIDHEKHVPLDRYMRIRIRKELGFNDPHLTPRLSRQKYEEEMRLLREEKINERETYFQKHEDPLDARWRAVQHTITEQKLKLKRIEALLNMPRESKLNEEASL